MSPGKEITCCMVCGQDMIRETSAAGHTASRWSTLEEATCEEPGREVSCCTVCQQDMIREIPAKGHDWVNGYCTRCQRQQSGN